MMDSLTWAEIDLAAIVNNVRRIKALAGTRVMAVVKADAYGHGTGEVGRAAQSAGADWLGVARAEEGLALRSAGLTLPILVMGYTPPALAAEAVGQDLTLTIFDGEAVQAYAAAARALNRRARAHLKVDTGMGRLGVLPEEAPGLYRTLRALDGLVVEGVFTHFANADAPDHPEAAHRQLARFEGILPSLDGRPALVHAANSAAAIALPAARLDLVRVGIALYGMDPSDAVPCPPGFRPALAWKARVTQVKTLPPGHGISYGHEYVTRAAETIAAVSVGYADGYRRVSGNEVLIRGRRAPVRGRVCMDQIVVGVGHIPGVRAGDEVVLLGRQADGDGRTAALSAEALARTWGTINYEVTSGIMARVARAYVSP